MLYNEMYMGGVLVHADRKNHKYIDKIKTKAGKWRYIYKNTLNYGKNKNLRDTNLKTYNEFINGKYDGGLRDPQHVNNWYMSPKKVLELRNSKYFKSYYNDPKIARQTKLERRDLQDEIKVNKLHKGDENYNRTHYAVDVPSSWGYTTRKKKTKDGYEYNDIRDNTKNHTYGTYEEIEAAKAKEASKKAQKEMTDSLQGMTKNAFNKAKARISKTLKKKSKKH